MLLGRILAAILVGAVSLGVLFGCFWFFAKYPNFFFVLVGLFMAWALGCTILDSLHY